MPRPRTYAPHRQASPSFKQNGHMGNALKTPEPAYAILATRSLGCVRMQCVALCSPFLMPGHSLAHGARIKGRPSLPTTNPTSLNQTTQLRGAGVPAAAGGRSGQPQPRQQRVLPRPRGVRSTLTFACLYEGLVLRNMTPRQLDKALPRLQTRRLLLIAAIYVSPRVIERL